MSMVITEKSTKAQIMEAYTNAMDELTELKKMTDNPVEDAKREAIRESVEHSKEVIDSGLFSDDTVKDYKDVMTAIKEGSEELENIYGIKVQAESLAAIINAGKTKAAEIEKVYKYKKDQLETEYKKEEARNKEAIAELKADFEKTKQKIEADVEEIKAENEKARKRAEDEWSYSFDKTKQKDTDEWDKVKEQWRSEIKADEDAVKAREDAVAAKENEFADMKAKIEAFPDELEFAKKDAVESTKKKLEDSARYAKEKLEMEKKHSEELLNSKIATLEASVESLTRQNKELSTKLDDAYSQMKELASDTVKSGVTVKVDPNK